MSRAIKAGCTVGLLVGLVAGAGWGQSGRGGGRVATGPGRVTSAGALHPNFTHFPQVPGLGFDYPHLAAVGGHANGSGNARAGNRNRFVTPIFTGILPFYSEVDSQPPYTESQPSIIVVPQPPQTIVVQQPAPQQTAAAELPATGADPAPAAAVPELGDFILVRRDGQVVLAAAFTVLHDRLTYVTRDGTRRSFPLSELDREATLQMNDASGTTLVLPD